MKTCSRLAGLLFVVLCSLSLQGCFPIFAAGVGTTAFTAADRRLVEVQISDDATARRISSRIDAVYGDKVRVVVVGYNRTIALIGQAPDKAAIREIEKLVRGTDNVGNVVNEIQVGAPISLSSISSDTYITTKIKARMVHANLFAPHLVKVITESGVAYLFGLLTQEEGNNAAEIARTTSGVLQVVRIIETISAEEAKRLDGHKPKSMKSAE